jgi:hypothetical protein
LELADGGLAIEGKSQPDMPYVSGRVTTMEKA